MKTLDEIATYWGTDKASWGHNYTALYEPLFEPLRNEPINLLELGWGSGCSAAMWMEYFPAATIAIVDNLFAPGWPDVRPGWVTRTPEPAPDYWLRLYRYQGDQASPRIADAVTDEIGALFDVIIDDASHERDLTIASFHLWWPKVHTGGYYIVEDIMPDNRYAMDKTLRSIDNGSVQFCASCHDETPGFSAAILRKNT